MNTQKVTKLLDQIGSTAHGLSGVTWAAKFRIKDQSYLAEQAEGIQVQIENLQAALDELKSEVQS